MKPPKPPKSPYLHKHKSRITQNQGSAPNSINFTLNNNNNNNEEKQSFENKIPTKKGLSGTKRKADDELNKNAKRRRVTSKPPIRHPQPQTMPVTIPLNISIDTSNNNIEIDQNDEDEDVDMNRSQIIQNSPLNNDNNVIIDNINLGKLMCYECKQFYSYKDINIDEDIIKYIQSYQCNNCCNNNKGKIRYKCNYNNCIKSNANYTSYKYLVSHYKHKHTDNYNQSFAKLFDLKKCIHGCDEYMYNDDYKCKVCLKSMNKNNIEYINNSVNINNVEINDDLPEMMDIFTQLVFCRRHIPNSMVIELGMEYKNILWAVINTKDNTPKHLYYWKKYFMFWKIMTEKPQLGGRNSKIKINNSIFQ